MPLYGAPLPITITNYHYILAFVFLGALVWLVVSQRHSRLFIFSVLFYILSTFFLYRYDLRDLNFVADRFMYLPSLGFCFFLGRFFENRLSTRKFVSGIFGWMFVFLFRCKNIQSNKDLEK